MIRKILLFVALVATVGAQAQIDTILNEPLFDKFDEESYFKITDEKKPLLLSEWSFDNCWVLTNNNIQVGSSSAEGGITTPALSALTGNARVNLDIYPVNANTVIYIDPIGSGTLNYRNINLKTSGTWNLLPSVILREGNSSSKIRVRNDGVNEGFEIRNVSIIDIGEDIFYESFDGNNGVGGNDDTYDIDEHKTPLFDNPSYSVNENVKGAKECILLLPNSSYTTSTLPTTSSRSVVLSFKMAGTDDEGNHRVDISTSGKATVSTVRSLATRNEWQDYEVTISSMGSSERIIFAGFDVFLDEIHIREKALETLTMNQAHSEGDNDNFDAMTVGTVANVTLTRTLTAGIWNTLCLPFRFDNTMLAGENHILRLTSVTDGCFNFTEDDAVPAGEPFLLQVSSTTANPTFNNVTIRTKSPGTKMFGEYGLQGIFYATDLETGESNAFLGTDGSLYYPADETKTMNGLRAYFVKPVSAPARVSFSFFEPAAIREVHREAVAREYNLWGQRVTSSRRGIIVRNGKKVYRQ